MFESSVSSAYNLFICFHKNNKTGQGGAKYLQLCRLTILSIGTVRFYPWKIVMFVYTRIKGPLSDQTPSMSVALFLLSRSITMNKHSSPIVPPFYL